MEKYLKIIDKQIESNQGKNIFLGSNDTTLKFAVDTITEIPNINELDADAEDLLLDYATNKVIEEFCRINQYYTFNSQARKDLRNIYESLFSSIKSNEISVEMIESNHYRNLRLWLRKTNSFAEKMYSNAGKDIKPVACSEYSADLQMNVLKLNVQTLMEPLLDIGCGKNGNLVKYLCGQGIDARGIDRFSFSKGNLFNADWLEFNYGTARWGTIISNLAFSNHFKHQHLKEDGSYIDYAKKYMEILKSLKIGGSFHYAPDLPFIELYLDEKQYQVAKHGIGQFEFKTTTIKRLK
jgi:hypothetical protein